MIRDLMTLDQNVSAAHFDVYWLYTRPSHMPNQEGQFGMIDLMNTDPELPDPADIVLTPLLVLPPLKVRAKGRPRKNDSSMKRLPSAWERGFSSSGAHNTSILCSNRLQNLSGRVYRHPLHSIPFQHFNYHRFDLLRSNYT